MANQAHGEPNRANPPTDSQKKKKKHTHTQRIINQTHHTHSHVAGRESRENQTPIQSIQSKSKTNSNTMFIKKKKKNPQYRSSTKTKPKKPQDSLVVAVAHSSLSQQ